MVRLTDEEMELPMGELSHTQFQKLLLDLADYAIEVEKEPLAACFLEAHSRLTRRWPWR